MSRLGLCLVLCLFAATLSQSSTAAARSLEIQKFDADIRVTTAGTVEITETLTVKFQGSWHGIYRSIPVEYRTPQGLNYTLFLDVVRVSDGEGRPLRWTSSREGRGRKLQVFVPGAEDALRSIVIVYIAQDALRFFDGRDELYWNVTGDDWDFPIQEASARIRLPNGVTGLRATAFTGAQGSRAQDAHIDIAAAAVDVRTRSALGFHEGLTVVVGWDKGVVHEPGLLAKVAWFLRSNWPLSLPFLAAGAMAALWYTRGRDPRLRPISPRYAPPKGLTPAEVGTLVDEAATMGDITATIVDLAVRRVLHIDEGAQGAGYAFTLRALPQQWGGLKAHETDLLTGMFSEPGVQTVQLSALENRFYANIPGIRQSIFASLLALGFYRSRPDRIRLYYLIAGIVIGAVSLAGGLWVASALDMAPLTVVVSAVLTALVICLVGRIMPARTERGTRALEEVLGFEDFLSHVDGDRFARTIKTPEMFEAFLPFAMALRVDKRWAVAFRGIFSQPPQWYSGSDSLGFDSVEFLRRLDRMSTQAGSSMASQPRSAGGSDNSGSSGFDGGSSGGGFGGGGGGGF